MCQNWTQAEATGIIQMTNNLGRARHSVRAALCQATRSAGRGMPALPLLVRLFVIRIIPEATGIVPLTANGERLLRNLVA